MTTQNSNSNNTSKLFQKIDVDWDGPTTFAGLAGQGVPSVPPPNPTIMNQEQRVAHLTPDEEAARKAGFNPKDPVFKLGDAVIDVGRENAHKSRQEWEGGLKPEEAVGQMIDTIQDEKRSDLMWDLNEFQMSKSGNIRAGSAWHRPNLRALRHLSELGGFSTGARYLTEACSPELQAINFNHQFKDRSEERRQELIADFEKLSAEDQKKKPLDTSWTARVRTRVMEKPITGDKPVNREVFAMTSPSYAPIDFRDIGEMTVDAINRIGGDARAVVKYDRDDAKGIIDFTFHSNLLPANYSAGEFFKMGMRLKWDDAKQGAVLGSAWLLRNLCLNLYILHNSEVDVFRIIHAGSPKSRLERLAEGILKMLSMGEHFISKWSKASAYTIDNPRVAPIRVNKKAKVEVKAWNDCSLEERIAGLVMGYAKRNVIEEPTKDELRQIVKAYSLDALTGSNTITVAALSNATSRAAKEALDAGTLDYWRSEKFQLAAGNIATTTVEPMFQYVYNLNFGS